MDAMKIMAVVAAALALSACTKKEEAKPTTANVPPGATTPGTAPEATPGGATQPTSAATAATAPQGSGSVTPRNLTLGTAIGADKKVTAATDKLAPKETAYVSVDLYGAGDAKVRASWTFTGPDGKPALVKSETQELKVTQPTTLEFHAVKPEGWPVGGYSVEVLVNDAPVGKKGFTVK